MSLLRSSSIYYVVLCQLSVIRFVFRFRRLPGLLITHQRAALYTARRQEMIEVVELMLFYLLQRPVVHSLYSDLPFQVSLL